MKYDKPHLSFEAQADQLIARGLVADKTLLIDRLKSVNYYRLSGYLYPYRQSKTNDNFKVGTTLERVWRHYTFDRRLRIIVMDAIERVEVGIRTQLIYHLSHQLGPFGYCNARCFPKLNKKQYDKWIKELREEADRSREVFVEHFRERYGDKHKDLPLWMIGEIMSFGKTLTMFNGCEDSVRRSIAREYGVEDQILKSWLGAINVIRNVCAHHGRLWNRELGYKPFLPRKQKYPQWHTPVPILVGARVLRESVIAQVPAIESRLEEFFEGNDGEYLVSKPDIEQIINKTDLPLESKKALIVLTQPPYRIFVILSILCYLLRFIAPQSGWKARLHALLDEYSEISRWSMGFPDNWKASPIWA